MTETLAFLSIACFVFTVLLTVFDYWFTYKPAVDAMWAKHRLGEDAYMRNTEVGQGLKPYVYHMPHVPTIIEAQVIEPDEILPPFHVPIIMKGKPRVHRMEVG